jgi:hypothetical protein
MGPTTLASWMYQTKIHVFFHILCSCTLYYFRLWQFKRSRLQSQAAIESPLRDGHMRVFQDDFYYAQAAISRVRQTKLFQHLSEGNKEDGPITDGYWSPSTPVWIRQFLSFCSLCFSDSKGAESCEAFAPLYEIIWLVEEEDKWVVAY